MVDNTITLIIQISLELSLTDILTKEEISSLIITPGINQTKIFLALKCNISYGPVVYKVDVIQKPNPSPLIDSYTYTIRNLEPFTNYTLSLTAARTTSNLNNASLILVTFFNFTTKPDGKYCFAYVWEKRGGNSVIAVSYCL